MLSNGRWFALLLVLDVGCTSSGKPSLGPRLEAVVPGAVFVDEATELRLSGDAFTPKATVRWGGGTGDVLANPTFEVFVGEAKLDHVTWVDSHTLVAQLPAGFPVGKHQVRIVDPYGAATSLADALEIRVRKGAVLTATLGTASNVVRVLKEVVAYLDLTNVGDTSVDAIGALQLVASGTAEVTAVGVTPGKTTLAPGASTRFELRWVSTKIGDLVLSAEARGVDARTGAAVRVGPLSTSVIQIIPPPDVISALVAARKVVSRGQVIQLELEVHNVGLVGVNDLLPSALPAPQGLVNLKAAPLKRDVVPGAKNVFSFFFDTLARGDVSFRVDARGTDALTGAAVGMTPAFETVSIVNPSRLELTLAPGALRLGSGQRFTLKATVVNVGDARALGVTPSIARAGAGGLTLVSAPQPAVVGAVPVTFVWEYDGAAQGAVELTVSASGTDENSGALVFAVPATVSLMVERPAALVASFTTPLRVNTNQSFGWSLDVANTGDTSASAVAPGAIAALGPSPGTAVGGPLPVNHVIPGGMARSFSFAHTAGDAGPLTFQGSANGMDSLGLTIVSTPLATSSIVQVERPARLVGALSLPAWLSPQAQFTATLSVLNAGEAMALAVTPSPLAITGNATVVSGPTPASALLSGDGGATFKWQLLAGTSGTVQVSGSATGTDSNDATALSTGPLTSSVGSLAGACVVLSECDGGTCTATPKAARAFCDGGQCDGAGRCAPFCDSTRSTLAACYQFEGNLIDGSQYGNSGTRIDGTFDAGSRGAAYFPGTAAIAVNDSATLNCTTALTLEAWIRLDVFPTAGSRFGVIDNEGQYGMFIGPGGELRCSAVVLANASGAVTLGAWHHVACIFGATGLRAFVNGTQVMFSPAVGMSLSAGSTDGLHIGENSPSGDRLRGGIDGVRIWCEARPPLDLCATFGECG